MIRAIVWRPDARAAIRELKSRDRGQSQRIGWAIDRFMRLGQGDVKRLTGRPGEYCLRVGDWRIRFTLDVEAETMVITQVARRSEATYRD